MNDTAKPIGLRERLEAIAALAKQIPNRGYTEVWFGTQAPGLVAGLEAIGGTKMSVFYSGDAEPYVIESTSLTIDGILFRASCSHAATAEEVAAFDVAPTVHEHRSEYRSAAIKTRGGA